MREEELLLGLLRAYSPSGTERPAVSTFVRSARALGYAARIDGAGNGIAQRGRGPPSVMFLGHIDTVDGVLPVRFHRGRIYGRGAVDAKGPLAAALLAGRSWSGPGSYVVVAAVEEERDSRGARYLLPRWSPKVVIAGEPSGWDGLTVGYKGELQIRASLSGTRSHLGSAHPTVADRGVDWVEAVRRYVGGRFGPTPFRSLSAKVVRWDGEHRGGEELARVTVDLRIPPGHTTRRLLRELPRPSRPSSLEVLIQVEPLDLHPSNPVARALIEGIRAEQGRPTVWRKTGTSDLNLVAPAWGVAGAAYGPGNARLDHTDRESVGLVELRRSVRVLEHALGRLGAIVPTLRRPAAGA